MSMPFTDDDNDNDNNKNKIRIEQEKVYDSYNGLSELDIIKIDYAFKEGLIKGFQIFDIKHYITAITRINISDKFVKRIRVKYIKDDRRWFLQLAKDSYAYVGIYRKAIDEIETYKKEMWKLILNPKVEHATKVSCFREMHALTKTSVLMAKDLPFIMNISKYFDYEKVNKYDSRTLYDRVESSNNELEHTHTKEYDKYYLNNVNDKIIDNIVNNPKNKSITREKTVMMDDIVSDTIMDQTEKFSMEGINKRERKEAENRYLNKLVEQVDKELDDIVKNEESENNFESIKQKAANYLSYLDEVIPKETRDNISKLRELSDHDKNNNNNNNRHES